jgi:hypothetical protein
MSLLLLLLTCLVDDDDLLEQIWGRRAKPALNAKVIDAQ